MKSLPLRGAVAFGLPALLVFVIFAMHPQGYWFLAAGPLCGIVGGLALGRRWGLSIVLGLCFGLVGFMFALQTTRSASFTDVAWTGLVSGFLFWVVGGCAVLTLPQDMRFNGAAALAIPGAIAGMVFQFFYGPAHFLFDLGARKWWGDSPWEHLLLWLIVGVGGGWLFGSQWRRVVASESSPKFDERNRWAIAAVLFALVGSAVGGAYFLRNSLPLGLFNSLSPASAAADWLWGWGVLAVAIALVGSFKANRRYWVAPGLAFAVAMLVVSYRVEANPWKAQFNSKYAEKLLRENPASGDAVYVGNLVLAQAALDRNDMAGAKQYLLQAVATSGTKRIEQNGLDVSVARTLFDRGEKDTVLEYLHRGRALWPQGTQVVSRWEAAIRAGRRPNFNARGQGGGQGQGAPQDR